MAIFANRNTKDTLRTAFYDLARDCHSLRLVAPFFSYAEILKQLGRKEPRVDLIVRLGPATRPSELAKALEMPNVHVRYFTSPRFHTKLYLFGDAVALVGSANLTDSGLNGNMEVMVTVDGESPDFDDLAALFDDYWSHAEALTPERLDEYTRIYSETGGGTGDSPLERAVKETFGDVLPGAGIREGLPVPSSEERYLSEYRRRYEVFRAAFREVESAYVASADRRTDGVPLRIEIDQFVSYVRERLAPGDSYSEAPLRGADERVRFTRSVAKEWFSVPWPYLEEVVVPGFALINDRLGTPQGIAKASKEELFEAIEVCHAFAARQRYFRGGLEGMRQKFLSENKTEDLRRSLTHLLHGSDGHVERMGRLIFDPRFKIRYCGQSVVQELLGWVNREDVPICNDRTLKALRFLGHDV